ncbi:IclR family transcriptional regulator [Sphingomonas abietis]|uniref:IclR family transcriptional regulator n=1 Tax=Sphingomonas abietis TaxID=3012344 RepID=A0ABY7NL26_9SPHN|nr:IclR family transcriptional regulator [Sphingomonas abietis]WBO21947.1 IclR family transcriptional regulator [Sphingomonas abietis]
MAEIDAAEPVRPSGSQTLFRGLDVLEAVADGVGGLQELADHLELTRSTTYRLAAALVERRYLASTPRGGFRLGSKLLELGSAAHRDIDLVQLARPLIEDLSATTMDTVHLGIMEGDRALYLDKIAGRRRITISSRVGEQQPLSRTGLGKALLLDDSPERWREIYRSEAHDADDETVSAFVSRMTGYASAGHAFDLEENDDRVRCVAAPIRDSSDKIVAAISVSSAVQYMDPERMTEISADVRATAAAISELFGWTGPQGLRPTPSRHK